MSAAARRMLLAAALWAAGPAGAAAAEDAEGRKLLDAMERASVRGDFNRVQQLRQDLAVTLERSGDAAGAARQYELLLAARPRRRERVRLFIQLGRMREALQDYGGAINAFQDAVHDEPRSWDARLMLARAYARIDLHSKALTNYRHCIALKPRRHEAYEEIGGVYQQLDQLDRAIQFYDKALRLRTKPEIFLAMVDCRLRGGDLAQAEAVLEKGKPHLPPADYLLRLGVIQEIRGDLKKAIGTWHQSLKADPKRDDVRLKLLLACGRTGRAGEADRLMRELVRDYPDSALVHFLNAWILLGRGDREGSRRAARRAQDLAPTELVRHYNDRLLMELSK